MWSRTRSDAGSAMPGVAPAEAGHDRVAGRIRVVDEEVAVAGIRGRERQPEETPLTAATDLRTQIQERARRDLAVRAYDQDEARLLDDEEPPAAVARTGGEDRWSRPLTTSCRPRFTRAGSNGAAVGVGPSSGSRSAPWWASHWMAPDWPEAWPRPPPSRPASTSGWPSCPPCRPLRRRRRTTKARRSLAGLRAIGPDGS